MELSPKLRYGIIAGHGSLLRQVIEACLQKNLSFFILAFHDQTEGEVIKNYPHAWVSLGQIGQALKHLKDQGVTHLVMAGRFHRPSFASLKLDSTGALWMADLGLKALGDDGLIKGLIKKLENEGFALTAPEALIGEDILMPEGLMGSFSMADEYADDGEIGFNILKALSPFDCGQAVIIQERRVLGIEGPEGTNSLLKRCASLIDSDSSRGAVLIKGSKESQELRADRPVVGPDTLKHLQALGYKGLILQAGGVLVVDQASFLERLKTSSLFCWGKRLK